MVFLHPAVWLAHVAGLARRNMCCVSATAFHSGTMTWIFFETQTGVFRHVFFYGDSVASSLHFGEVFVGQLGRSLNHSREVHSSVGVLIRRIFPDKYDPKIQVIIIFLDVACYTMVIKDESVHLLFKILCLWHCLVY